MLLWCITYTLHSVALPIWIHPLRERCCKQTYLEELWCWSQIQPGSILSLSMLIHPIFVNVNQMQYQLSIINYQWSIISPIIVNVNQMQYQSRLQFFIQFCWATLIKVAFYLLFCLEISRKVTFLINIDKGFNLLFNSVWQYQWSLQYSL